MVSAMPPSGGGPTALPKIPLFGPAAHMGVRLLCSRIGEMNGSPRNKATPRGHHGSGRRALPAVVSARGRPEPQTGEPGLQLRTYHGDHAYHLRTARTSSPRIAYDSAQEKKKQARALEQFLNDGAWAASSHDDSTKLTSSLRGRSGARSLSPLPHLTPRRAQQAHAVPPTSGQTGSKPSGRAVGSREAAISASFKREPAEIEAAFRSFQYFRHDDGLYSDVKTKSPVVERLLRTYDGVGLAGIPERRPNLITRVPSDDPLTGAELLDSLPFATASSAEICGCTATLNFYRWLCGLAPVQLSPVRLEVCDVISNALLPREPPSQGYMLPEGWAAFAESATVLVGGEEGRVSVLHGEASLCAALEQSLSSTHAVAPPQGVLGAPQSLDQAVGSILTRVANASGTGCDAEGDRRAAPKPTRRARDPPRPVLDYHELPEALKPLSLFWKLLEYDKPHRVVSKDKSAARRGVCHVSLVHSVAEFRSGAKPRCASVARATETVPTLDAVWADRHGALDFRRCLLNPSLRLFGVARRQDTCVMWTSADRAVDQQESAERPRRRSHARGGSSRVDPPVSIDEPPSPLSPRSAGADSWDGDEARPKHDARSEAVDASEAERIDAVCFPPAGYVPMQLLRGGRTPWTIMPNSMRFQPTAETRVSAWRVKINRDHAKPTAERTSELTIRGFTVDCSTKGEPFCVVFWPDLQETEGRMQLEVVLSGLRGVATELTFFYELVAFLQNDLDTRLCLEGAWIREVFGDREMWADEPRPLAVVEEVPAGSAEQKKVCRSKQPLVLETVSHHDVAIVATRVDVVIVLRSEQCAAMRGKLCLIRFGEDEEEVLNAVQVQKLPGSYFIVRIKLPMAHSRYELRLYASSWRSPHELVRTSLVYQITTADQCQTLLSSLEDPLSRKFGLASVFANAQLHGVLVLAPMTRRIVIGRSYFLVHVDRALAVATEQESISRAQSPRVEEGGGPGARGLRTRFFEERLGLGLPGVEAPRRPAPVVVAAPKHAPVAKGRGTGVPVKQLHGCLRSALERHTQDTTGDVHLDVVLRGTECIARLRERDDAPGFFEGFVNFSIADVSAPVQLLLRCPGVHAGEFTPRRVCEWLIVSGEHFPINF